MRSHPDAPRFLTQERALLYGAAVFLIYLGVLAIAWWQRIWFIKPNGQPIVVDFLNFWASGFVSATGDMSRIFDVAVYKTIEEQAIGHDFTELYPWVYPPSSLLLTTPLSVMPYLLAWFVWVVVGVAFLVAALCFLVPWRVAVALVVAAPASLWCGVVGQNGFLTAGFMGCALALLERRGFAGGLFVGLLSYKPQFGVLFPIFLIATRNWRGFAGAVVGTISLVAASAMAYGADAWFAFLATLSGTTGGVLMGGGASWAKLQSVYAIFHAITDDSRLALLAHAGCCVMLLAMLVWLWTQPCAFAVKAAAFVAGSYLFTPYAYVYDAVLLTLGMAFLVKDGLAGGFLKWDKPLLLVAWASPALFGLLDSFTAPLGAALILGLSFRRAFTGGGMLNEAT